MATNIRPFSKKINSQRLARSYKRFVRINRLPKPKNVSKRAIRLAPRAPQGHHYATTPEPPAPGFQLIGELWLDKELSTYNSALLFRMLRLMFGDADIVGCFISTTKSTKQNIVVMGGVYLDWSYSITLSPTLIAEVRSRYGNTRTYLRYWTNESVPPKNYPEIRARFWEYLEKDCEGNKHLFDEGELRESNIVFAGSANVYGERRRAASELLELAARFDRSPEPRLIHFGEDPPPHTTGALYLATGLFLVLSLEALVNILNSALLHDEYKQEHFERITKRGDVDLRLAAMHTFCRGFQKPIFDPDSNLLNQFLPIRAFRNHFLHGNVGDEDRIYAFIEEGFMFFHNPAMDFRGIKGERSKEKSLPSTMKNFALEEAKKVEALVDRIVGAIRDAMVPNYRVWFDSWLTSSIVKPPPSPGD